MTRAEYMRQIHACVSRPTTRDDQVATVQALLCVAATVANAMSSDSVGFSTNHVEESANAMIAVLEETFGIELGD